MAQNEPTRRLPQAKEVSKEIPDKLYFRIGDVAKLCDVPAYVLRFWESEFPQLKPNKGGTGQRLYRRRDVEMALRIKRLLYDEGYTIPGARQVFKSESRGEIPSLTLAPEPVAKALRPDTSHPDPNRLQALRQELEELYALLSTPPALAQIPAVPPISIAAPPITIRSPRKIHQMPTPQRGGLFDLFDSPDTRSTD